MGSLPHISVAGGTATGTHGSGDGNGILATAITGLEIIRADGSLTVVDRTNPDLDALAVGLGAFGVISRVTLHIEPTYLMRQDVYFQAPWEAVLDQFDEIMASAYSVSLMADFSAPVVQQLWQKSRVEDGAPDVEFPRSAFGGTWFDDANEIAKTSLNVRGGIPGPWADRLPHFRLDSAPSVGGDELQSEYFVDRRHAVEALRVLRGLGKRISPHLHATEIRTVAADGLWLSPAFERDSVSIGFTWRKHPAAVGELLHEIEDALTPYAPRPHWGKLFHLGATELAGRFPRLADFRALVKCYDPGGKFWNSFLDGVLAPPA
jgi:xylitol oxidase